MRSSFFVVAAVMPLLAAAHGYLSSPEPRGIEKEAYQIDELKSPNLLGLCRGEPAGKIHLVQPGQKMTLGFTITAPHTGPCVVTILDENLGNERPVTEKYDCAAPGKVAPWTITLPSNARGRQVLRWYWQGRHVSPGEDYEQCIDLDFGSGNGAAAPTFNGEADVSVRAMQHVPAHRTEEPAPAPLYETPQAAPQAPRPSYDQDERSALSYEVERPAPSRRSRKSRKHASGGPCEDGAYRCIDSGFQQCANGEWSARLNCAPSTQCRKNGNAIVCA